MSWILPEVNRISLLQVHFSNSLNLLQMVLNHHPLLRIFNLTHSIDQISKIGKNEFWYHVTWIILTHFNPCSFSRINVIFLSLEHKSQSGEASVTQTSDNRRLWFVCLFFNLQCIGGVLGAQMSCLVAIFIVRRPETRKLHLQTFLQVY